jgi:hypothetical protein
VVGGQPLGNRSQGKSDLARHGNEDNFATHGFGVVAIAIGMAQRLQKPQALIVAQRVRGHTGSLGKF